MTSYQDLVDRAEPAAARLGAKARPLLAVAIDTSSLPHAALETRAALEESAAALGLDIDVMQSGGNGLLFASPAVRASLPDGTVAVYQKVWPADASEFLETLIKRNEIENPWLLGVEEAGSQAELPSLQDNEWWTIQPRRLMRDMGVIDPEDILQAIARGAYGGLERALSLTKEEVIAEVTTSRLGGRGGSYFPTGRKWDFLRTSPTSPKALICNADEGDGGAWVNRMTLENDPHALIEGMLIGGWATGAERGYIYIREEYPLAFERVSLAVEQATEIGLLGGDILGRQFNFDLKIIRGAGSYVCGEESGLIASIEDGRGMPKIRPPFPAASGVLGQGTNVNNVQSYHTAAWILRHGLDSYREIGTERNPGSMMFTLSGQVQRPGCYELPFGTTVRQAYEACAGGPPQGGAFKATQPGGPLTGVMPALSLDLPMEPEEFREVGMGTLGGGGFVFLDQTSCIIDLCAHFEWFLEDESCGRCTTCHGGTQRMVEVLRRIQAGGGRASDISKFELLAKTLQYSNCVHGQAAPAIIQNMLEWFRDELEEHIFAHRCRAQVCKGLIRYEIVEGASDAPALAKAPDYCPTDAIRGDNGTYAIDDSACVRCDACRVLASEAIRVVDAHTAGTGPAPELISVQPAYDGHVYEHADPPSVS